MQTLLEIGGSNAVVAMGLALFAMCVGLATRRAALEHGLWILVFAKLVTPPLCLVPLLGFGRSADPIVRAPRSHQQAEGESLVSGGFVGTGVVDSGLPRALSSDTWSFEPAADSGSPVVPSRGGPAVATDFGLKSGEFSDSAPRQGAASVRPAAAIISAASEGQAPGVGRDGAQSNQPAPNPFWRRVLSWSGLIPWLGYLWLCGSLLYMANTLLAIIRFHRLLRHAEPAGETLRRLATRLASQMGLRQAPELLLVPGTVSPMVWAVGRPKLLMPRALLAQVDTEQAKTLLAHELAHLRRGDHSVRLLELLATTLYWWHPIVWFARRRLRELQEEMCDAWVVWSLPSARRIYATALLDTVDFLSEAARPLPPGATGVGQVTFLKRRLAMIMQGTEPKSLSALGRLGVVLLGAALLPWAPTMARGEGDGEPAADDREIEVRERSEPVEVEVEVRRERRPVEVEVEVRRERRPVEVEVEVRRERRTTEEQDELAGLLRRIGSLLVDGKLEEAKQLAAQARELRHSRAAARTERQREEAELHESTELRERAHEDSEHTGRQRQREERQRERVIEGQGRRGQLERELREQMNRLEREIKDAAAQIQHEIKDAVAESASDAEQVIEQIDVDDLTEEAIKDVPQTVQSVLREIDLEETIEQAMRANRPARDSAQPSSEQPAPDARDAEELRQDLNRKLREQVARLTERIQEAAERIQSEVAATIRDVAEVAEDMDVQQLVEEATERAPESVRQFLRELDVSQLVEQAVHEAHRAAEQIGAEAETRRQTLREEAERASRAASRQPWNLSAAARAHRAHDEAAAAARAAEQAARGAQQAAREAQRQAQRQQQQVQRESQNRRPERLEQRLSRLESQLEQMLREFAELKAGLKRAADIQDENGEEVERSESDR